MPNTTGWGLPKPALTDSPDVPRDVGALADAVDGHLSTIAGKAGVSQSGIVRRGKSIVLGEEETASLTPALLATPDRVSGLVLPTDGLIFVAFQALWAFTGLGSALALLYVDGSPVKIPFVGGNGYLDQTTTRFANANDSGAYTPLSSHTIGLISGQAGAPSPALTDPPTTGLTVAAQVSNANGNAPGAGGICAIWAAAGTHEVSVRWAVTNTANPTTVKAKQRRLWAWTEGF